jgi:hypothetical protein
MGIVEITVFLILGYIFYWLFFKGNAWPILFFIFGIFGGNILITKYFPSSNAPIMTFLNYPISWATFIGGIVALLAIGKIMNLNDGD